jgi:eukaryotic-like serine/threonine-protein kinase
LRERKSHTDTLVDLVPAGTIAEPPSGVSHAGTSVRGRFRLETIIGSGAMGTVFGGLDVESGAEVAVKLLHDKFAQSEQHVGRFLHEAHIQRSILHPGVVHVIDFGRDEEGRWFIALERLRGEELGSVLEANGALPGEEVVEIGHQLLSVLAAAHGHGVIHRDVKPENIFLARNDDRKLRVKLLDFGIAKTTGVGNFAGAIRTHEGVKLGTPHYMSPEQWRGEPLSARSDVWAAGAVLWTAVMGSPPHDADDLGALMDLITVRPAPSLARLRPEIGPAFVDTIDRALATDPERRFADCRAMAAALHTGGVRVEELDW